MSESTKKRGRPPRTITSRDGTEILLRDYGITRKQVSDWIAIASIPQDVFEERLASIQRDPIAKARRKTSTQAMVRFACELGTTNRKAPMRDRCPLNEARRMVGRLGQADRIALAWHLAELIRAES